VEHKTTVERSRFHALLFPARTQEEMEEAVRRQRAEFRKARHHCWAFRSVAAGGAVSEGCRDDGEVGRPGRVLLELLRKHDLEGGVVVSRIFGGVKLGVGGVSRAFREAGEAVITEFLTARR